MPGRFSSPRWWIGFAAIALVTVVGRSAPAIAQATEITPDQLKQAVHDDKQQWIFSELRERKHELREAAERAKKASHQKRGAKAREEDLNTERVPGGAAAQIAGRFGIKRVEFTPFNAKANDKTLDNAGAGQAEQGIAFRGLKGLCAWNDGQGFNVPPDVQGYGYTNDGGNTWIDGGVPAKSAAITAWTSDPVVTVNEKTGDFYYNGLISGPLSTNGVGMVRGTFVGNAFVWDTPHVIASGPNASQSFDKEWMVADSSNGNLYATWTLFIPGADNIFFSRSTDNGVTWSVPLLISLPGEAGLVQGSRPCVGPNGEVYVTYSALGPTDADFMRICKSTDAGVSFSAPITAASEYSNFGTGAPGFNRARGITFPSIAVDRSLGANRGRVYITYNETVNWYNEYYAGTLGSSGAQNEIENNGNFANATPFTIGNMLRGGQNASNDVDNWKFAATQGTTYIFIVDSLRTTLNYTLRIYCPNDTSVLARVAISGPSSAGRPSYLVWTAPTNQTYYFRWQSAASTGGYRIRTGTHTPYAGDNARDTRDAMLVSSPDGLVWGLPVRVTDDPGYLDDWLPEVAVPCDGNAYTMWFDWRDAAPTCYAGSNIYVSRSSDGGATWAPNQVATTAPTPNWTQVASNIAPNQGDYNGMYGGDVVGLAFADGRLGDADVFAARLSIMPSLTCPNDTTVLANTTYNTTLFVTNSNQMFANNEFVKVTADRSWPGLPSSAGLGSIPALGSVGYAFSLPIPDTAATGDVHLCFTATCDGGTCAQVCCVTLHVLNPVTATLASLVNASADVNGVKLTWEVTGLSAVNVYRTEGGSSWNRIGTATPDGTHRVTYSDASVAAGHTYGYRLGFPEAGGEVMAGETFVDVPRTAEFALRGARPNPSVGPISFAFSLADNSPATLEMVDLVGRRVYSRQVGSLGAGFHVVPMESTRLPIGVYAMRLTQHGRTLSSKVSVIR